METETTWEGVDSKVPSCRETQGVKCAGFENPPDPAVPSATEVRL